MSGGKPGPHKIEGIGAGFVPGALDMSVVDDIVAVSDKDAIDSFNFINDVENYSAGISSGAVLEAAKSIINHNQIQGRIVLLFADGKDRYCN